MNFIKVLMGGSWFILGLIIMVVSLLNVQRAMVWGAAKQNLDLKDLRLAQNRVYIEDFVVDEVSDLLAMLPEAKVMPGEIMYPFKATKDRMWLTLASSEAEKGRRMLHLSNERLRQAWELCQQGRMKEGIETLMKAESYLSKVKELSLGEGRAAAELRESAGIHVELLSQLEMAVPEELRPMVTKLLDVPKGMTVSN